MVAESGLFAQNAVVSNKSRNPNILNVQEIENCNSFSFSQNFLPFWLAESGLFAQKAVVSYKGWNPNILNVLEINNCNSFSFFQKFLYFQKFFDFLAKQKVVYLLKRQKFPTKVENPTS